MRFRRLDLTFTALLLPLDALALFAAAVSAYALRFSRFVSDVLPILQDVNFQQYLSTASLFVAVWMVLFALAGLYSTAPRKAWNELGRIIIACGAGTMVVIASVFFRREIATSRFIVLAVLLFSVVYVWIGRLLLRVVRHAMLRAKVGHRRIIVVGASRAANDVVATYAARPILGFTVVKQFDGWSDRTRRDIRQLKHRGGLDGVLLADPDLEKSKALELIAFAEEEHLTFSYLADLFAASFTNIKVTTDAGVPIIQVNRTPLDGWGRIAKRAFDLTVSGALIVFFSPVMLLTALAVWIDSGLPIFFRLDDDSVPQRVGERGLPFRYLKFRSMKQHTHNLRYTELAHLDTRKGPLVKTKNDPRITRVGRFIRKWSLDELPELFLVFRGDMSLVGPRPHLPEEVADYEPHQRRVLAIKPGITGMAQISGRSDLSFDDEVRLDTWYIENWSLWLDLYILLKTPQAVIAHRNATD